jgi:hypothetical protein
MEATVQKESHDILTGLTGYRLRFKLPAESHAYHACLYRLQHHMNNCQRRAAEVGTVIVAEASMRLFGLPVGNSGPLEEIVLLVAGTF